jgi:dihydrofolate reductase
MRKVIFGGANSLDNFIARKDHAVDWLLWNDEVAAISTENWQRFDTVLMGRKTYQVALGFGTAAYPNVKNYVFSRTMKESHNENIEIISVDAAEFVRHLKNQDGGDICLMGGGELAKSLFEVDLIDEIGFNIHPVLLGSSVSLFHEMKDQIDLELLECRVLKTGCVYVTYRVKHKTDKN